MTIDYRDVAAETALLVAFNEAEADIQNGRLVSNEQMKKRIFPRIMKNAQYSVK